MYLVKKFKDNVEIVDFTTDSYVQAILDDLKRNQCEVLSFTQNILVDGTVNITTKMEGIHYTVELTEETDRRRKEHNLELLGEVVKDLLVDETQAYCTIAVGEVMSHQHYILTYGKGDFRKNILIPETEIHMYSHSRLVAMLKEELNGSI